MSSIIQHGNHLKISNDSLYNKKCVCKQIIREWNNLLYFYMLCFFFGSLAQLRLISYGCGDDDFGKEPYTGFTASLPSHTISSIYILDSIKPLYFLHRGWSDTSILAGAMVILWDSLCPLSPVHLTVTFSNPTLLLNSLLMASNTCTNSPHLSTLLTTVSWIAFVTAFCTGIIGMPLMPASQPWHHFQSLILSMVAFAKCKTQTLRSSNPINLPHPQHTSKLLSLGPSAQGCPTMPNGFAHWALIKNSCMFVSLSTIPCSSTTNLYAQSTTTSTLLCSVHLLW